LLCNINIKKKFFFFFFFFWMRLFQIQVYLAFFGNIGTLKIEEENNTSLLLECRYNEGYNEIYCEFKYKK